MQIRWTLFFLIPAWSQAATEADALRVLAANCLQCHGSALKTSGLDLRTRESLLAGGTRGPALVPGAPEKSRLYRFAAGVEQPSMPPGKKLAAADLETLRIWIEAGAKFPENAKLESDPKKDLAKLEDRPVTEKDRQFWSFQPPVRRRIPEVANATLVRNPIDAFLLETLEKRNLKPAPQAPREVLIRRATLDLTGLPPSPDEVKAFVADPDPQAYEKLVDRLLASPRYGERWARHWLDLVRYADSAGYEFDEDRPNAWRYRDYVIQSLNADKPYDRFVKEQLAGDEIAPKDPDALVATGFLRHGPEANIKNDQTRMDELDDILATTSGAFLGMTAGCARCHNHKFDPIPQKDYYRMIAVFSPTRYAEVPLAGETAVAREKAANQRIDDLLASIKKEREALLLPFRTKILDEKRAALPAYILEALRTPAEKRTPGQKLNAEQVEKTLRESQVELMASLTSSALAQLREIDGRIEMLEAQRPQRLPVAMAISDVSATPPPSYFLHNGGVGNKGSVVEPGVLTVASRGEFAVPPPAADAKSSGRRRAFAEWIASPENPLTARVMVNRLWQHHFGEGIVASPNNFGKSGMRPSHPELLDWLATEFVARGWSMKAMHRLMLTASAYQRSSDDIAANLEIDPGNKYLWRMPRRRLEGEALRDSVLAVAGVLNAQTGGPGIHPYIDPALWQASSGRKWPGQPDWDPAIYRRSVYIFTKRTIPVPMLEVFDKPDATSSCARRNRSTTAPQALILMNNAFFERQARYFAQRLQREAGESPEAQVKRAFELALARQPSPSELRESTAFLKQDAFGLADFCQTIFNLNEFAYLP